MATLTMQRLQLQIGIATVTPNIRSWEALA